MSLSNNLGCFVFAVAPGGVIQVSKHYPESVGDNFLDYCADEESRARWKAAYAACLALHEDQTDVRVRLRLNDDRVVHLNSDLHWDGGDRVLFYVVREWPVDLLTEREREVLQLLACDQSAKTIAQVTGVTPDNARATISRIRKKLSIVDDSTLVTAACFFRELDEKSNREATPTRIPAPKGRHRLPANLDSRPL